MEFTPKKELTLKLSPLFCATFSVKESVTGCMKYLVSTEKSKGDRLYRLG
jgi:hypothetical protein